MSQSISEGLFSYGKYQLDFNDPESYGVGKDYTGKSFVVLDCAERTFLFPMETYKKAEEVAQAILDHTGDLVKHSNHAQSFYLSGKPLYEVTPDRLVNLAESMATSSDADLFWNMPQRLEKVFEHCPGLSLYLDAFQDSVEGTLELPPDHIVRRHEEILKESFDQLFIKERAPSHAWDALYRYVFDGVDDLDTFVEWWMVYINDPIRNPNLIKNILL